MLENFLKSIKIDAWYMALVYVGGLLLVLSIFFPTQWITNKQLILFSSGMFFIGLGEWKNHKYQSWIKEANFFTGGPALMKARVRKANIVGNILIAIGFILILLGFIDFLT